jgi:sigma-B regulation protein RsbU (phosphoserine phosphatase)
MVETGQISAEQMKLVLNVSRMLAVTADLDPLLQRIAEAATTLLSCERASIFLHDPNSEELWTKVALQSKEIRIPSHVGIVGHAFKTNEILLIPEPYKDPRFNPEPDKRSGFLTRNLLTSPMVDMDRQPIGVIQAVNKNVACFTDTDRAMIQLLADQAGVAIQRYRLQLAALEIVALRREMDLAKKVQEKLIPKSPPDVPGLEATGWTRAASVTGGDCFDLWRMQDGRLGIFLGDASGHGLAPALVVSQVRTLVRTVSETEPDPGRLLMRVNTRLAEDLETGRFVTAFLGFLSSDGCLSWSSAGHGPVLFRAHENDPLITLDAPLPPLGVIPDPWTDPVEPMQMSPTGQLIVMSDGIFEAFSPTGEQFGIHRVTDLLNQRRCDAGDKLIPCIRDEVVKWQGRDEPVDDQTIVLVRRKH